MKKKAQPAANSPNKARRMILFGYHEKEGSPEIEALSRAAFTAVQRLFMAVWRGDHQQEASNKHTELYTLMGANTEVLWRSSKHKSFVQGSASRTSVFPLLYTDIESITEPTAEEMRRELVLRVPARKKGTPGVRPAKDLLNDELRMFVEGVIRPGMLRWRMKRLKNKDRDVIRHRARRKLVGHDREPGKWANVFMDEYLFRFRPDLLTRDCLSGQFAQMTKARQEELSAKNEDDTSLRHAFQTIVIERLRTLKRLLKAHC